MALETEIDRDLCMGSGNCVFAAPGAFDLDEDSIAFVVDPAGAPLDQVVDAARNCPTGAISVRQDGTELG
jgi:ferredoxin